MKPNFKYFGGKWLAIVLFLFTLTFGVFILYTHKDIRNIYTNNITKGFNTLTFGVFDSIFNIYKISTPNQPHDINNVAFITEFGTTTEVIIIDELNASTSSNGSEIYLDTEKNIKEKISPESAWVNLYLYQFGLSQQDLNLDITNVKEWQQTGGLMRNLKIGSKGKDVRLVQYLLSIFDPEFKITNASGIFGPQTKASIIKLQKKFSQPQTGIFTEELRFFFDSIYFKELCPDSNPKQDKSFENVSRRTAVPLDYIPADLIRLPRTIRTIGVMCLSREPAMRLEALFAHAKSQGHELAVFSAYRSSNTQKLLREHYFKAMGKTGLEGVAEAGHSEHQLGTTVDISGKSLQYLGPSVKLGKTKEGKWLAENSYKHGFILSYPEHKKEETGYIYEPWHFRYIGIDIAKDIFDEKLTIQEYLNLVKSESDPSTSPLEI